jgi:hypothetical protein
MYGWMKYSSFLQYELSLQLLTDLGYYKKVKYLGLYLQNNVGLSQNSWVSNSVTFCTSSSCKSSE